MLYLLASKFNDYQLMLSLIIGTFLFLAITITKERKNERNRI